MDANWNRLTQKSNWAFHRQPTFPHRHPQPFQPFPHRHPQGLGGPLCAFGQHEALNLSQLWEVAPSSPPGAGWALRPKCLAAETGSVFLFVAQLENGTLMGLMGSHGHLRASIVPKLYLALLKSVPCALVFGGLSKMALRALTEIFNCRYRHRAECVARWDGSAYALLALFLVLWKPLVFSSPTWAAWPFNCRHLSQSLLLEFKVSCYLPSWVINIELVAFWGSFTIKQILILVLSLFNRMPC